MAPQLQYRGRMIQQHPALARAYFRPPRFAFAGFGEFIPDASLIKTDLPVPGYFFRPLEDILPWTIAKEAYEKRGLLPVKEGLFLINNSQWNGHVRKSKKYWESYKVKGFQIEKRYKATDPHAGYGSGKDWPTLWIPPEDGSEPEQVFAPKPKPDPIVKVPTPVSEPEPTPVPPSDDAIRKAVEAYLKKYPPPQGPAGAPGSPGKPGAPGAPGRAPTEAEISNAVVAYFKANPPSSPAISQAQIAAIVKAYLEQNPPAQGPAGPPGRPPTQAEIQKEINAYFIQNPISPAKISDTQIAQFVDKYLKENPPSVVPGPPGPPPTDAQVYSAVQKWAHAHPSPAGGSASGGPSKPQVSPFLIFGAMSLLARAL